MGRFTGKVAIVTGGAGGIGGAIVARFASEGAEVMVADLSEPPSMLEKVAYVRTDVTQAADVAAALEATLQRWGRLDILVNNAGLGALAETPDMGEDLWDRVFAVNAKAIFLFCQAAIPAIRKVGGGSIVNIASISGLFGDYGMDAYNASKGAVVNYTRNLALNCARDGIRVNALCPGLVATQMTAAGIANPEDRSYWFDRIPLRRAAQPEEMAAVVAFLASEDASYMTGSILVADGGITAHSGQPDFPLRLGLRTPR
jgi:meso-butanediol dehydrogenase/(S,S)-butanediol dehydrogenase/diacetyl reductase